MLFHGAVNAASGLLQLDAEGGSISVRVAVLIAAYLTVGVVVAAFGAQRMTSDARWRQQEEIRHPTVDDPR